MPFEHILFPADFSARSHAMIATVEDLARRFQSRVTILHVVEAPLYSEVAYEMMAMDAVRQVASRQLEAFAARDFAGVSVTRVMREGRSGNEIVQAAQELGASLIVMPTAGYTRFRELLLGSVTTSVLHDTPVPVFTSAHTEEAPRAAGYERIVCAVDLSAASVEVLKVAHRVATHLQAELTVVHSVPGVDERWASGPSERAHRFLCTQARENYPALAAAAGVTAELRIDETVGSPADGIVAAANAAGAGLIIAGRGEVQGFLGRLRTNIHELIRKSPVPVLSV